MLLLLVVNQPTIATDTSEVRPLRVRDGMCLCGFGAIGACCDSVAADMIADMFSARKGAIDFIGELLERRPKDNFHQFMGVLVQAMTE